MPSTTPPADLVVSYPALKTWDMTQFGVCPPDDAAYFSAELQRAGVKLGTPLAVVEIGFGNGAFLGWARAQRWKTFGIEINPELRQLALAQGTTSFPDISSAALSLGPDSVDLVVAFDVFEHMTLDDVVAGLSALRGLLRPGGTLIVRVPNGGSPFGRDSQHADLTHITTFSQGKFSQLSTLTSLPLVSVDDPILPLSGVGLARALKRGVVIFGQTLMGALIRWLYFSGVPMPMAPNCVAVFRKPK